MWFDLDRSRSAPSSDPTSLGLSGAVVGNGGLGAGFRLELADDLEGGGLAPSSGPPTGVLEVDVHHDYGEGSRKTNLYG